MNKIVLKIEEKDMTLSLLCDGEVFATESWVDENNLLEVFFDHLAKILESKSLSASEIDEFVLETDLPTGYTTLRIAKTLIRTLQFARG